MARFLLFLGVLVAVAAAAWLVWRPTPPTEPAFQPRDVPGSEVRLWAPASRSTFDNGEVRLTAGPKADVWLESPVELTSAVFDLRGLIQGLEIDVRFGPATSTYVFTADSSQRRLFLEPHRPDLRQREARFFYRLRISTRPGDATEEPVLVVSYLGTRAFLEQDLYALSWEGCGAPAQVSAGENFLATARLRNLSAHPWPHQGNVRVRLSYRWLDADGTDLGQRALLTDLRQTVEPDAAAAHWLKVRAPAEPGPYLLEFDPLFDRVAWFSERNGAITCRAAVEVVTGDGPRSRSDSWQPDDRGHQDR